MDAYRIDSHKLMYHVSRVGAWMGGRDVFPIYMEVSPSGACNHRCTFCALDFLEYQHRLLDAAILKERLTEMGRLGLKAIMYAGEGEPLLYPEIATILEHTADSGIDAALTTNGVLLSGERAERILPVAEWIKVSINAGTARTYAAIHRTKERDFETVLDNVAAAAALKRSRGYRCTLGMQMVLLPENRGEAEALARTARDAGADYLVIKPYSQHPSSRTIQYQDVRYEEDSALAERLSEMNTESFQVIFRIRAAKKWDASSRPYKRCLALPFWSYLDAGGSVWGCSVYLGDERFLYGNINENTFQEIWEGPRRRESLRFVAEELDASRCRVNCRMDEINRYLLELKVPPAHVNFI